MQISLPTSLAQAPTAPQPREKIRKAALDFEAVLLGSLLESMEKTFSGMGEADSLGSGDYRYLGAQALASGMAARGGIGIARMIMKSFERTKVLKGG